MFCGIFSHIVMVAQTNQIVPVVPAKSTCCAKKLLIWL
jgi:hypothetical protein